MKITHLFVLLAVAVTASAVQAEDCSAQFSMCLRIVAANPSAGGTDGCISQRTACVASLGGAPGVIAPPVVAQYDPFATAIMGNSPNLHREHREQNRSLIKSQIDERRELLERQHSERDANNWREFGQILKQQAHERQDLRQEQRLERRGLAADQKFDGAWTAW